MTRPRLKKRYGQHHLSSGALCRPLIDFLRPHGERVVEIGPGGGVLTAELAAAEAAVWALEVDLEWACHLRLRRLPGVSVLAVDALVFPWARLPAPTLVAGNLPFNVGTRLIEEILAAACAGPDRLPRLAFMVQKEVADRLTAAPGGPGYGALSVLTRAQAAARRLGVVAPGAFRPPPKVAAAFVGLVPRRPSFGAERLPEFRRLVHLAFNQKRKMLRNSLAAGWGRERATRVLATAGIAATVRAETLDVADFAALLDAFERDRGIG